MVPFRNPATAVQTAYNKLLTKERVIIERVFGMWKRRFPILHGEVRIKSKRVPSLVITFAVLHNIGKYLNDDGPEMEDEVEEDEEEDMNDGDDVEGTDAQERRAGRQKRDELYSIKFLIYACRVRP